MKIRTVIGAASAAIAIATAAPASAHDVGDKVTRNFEQAIPNIPGKSLIAVVVDYPPGEASAPHTHAKSAFIYVALLLWTYHLVYFVSASHSRRRGRSPSSCLTLAFETPRSCIA